MHTCPHHSIYTEAARLASLTSLEPGPGSARQPVLPTSIQGGGSRANVASLPVPHVNTQVPPPGLR